MRIYEKARLAVKQYLDFFLEFRLSRVLKDQGPGRGGCAKHRANLVEPTTVRHFLQLRHQYIVFICIKQFNNSSCAKSMPFSKHKSQDALSAGLVVLRWAAPEKEAYVAEGGPIRSYPQKHDINSSENAWRDLPLLSLD